MVTDGQRRWKNSLAPIFLDPLSPSRTAAGLCASLEIHEMGERG